MNLFDATLLNVAHRLASSRDPIDVYRRLGALPHRPVSHERYVVQRHAPPPAFEAHAPLSQHPEAWWTHAPVRDFALSDTVSIDAGFASRVGNVYDSRGDLLVGASHKYRDVPRRGWVPRPYTASPSVEKLPGEAAVLTAHGQDTYFHWLFDILPRFARLELESREPDHLYARAELAFQRETLELIGIRPAAIVECGSRPLISADRLLVPCHEISRGRQFPAWVLGWLRGRLLAAALEQCAEGRGERIYVARSGTRHRNVTNEPELERQLTERGFTAVRLEDLSVAAQMRCFHEAKVIVAPHGSGLANLAFCQPGTRVVELFPGPTIDLYYRLSHAVGLHYAYLTTEDRAAAFGTADYSVDLVALEATFSLLGV